MTVLVTLVVARAAMAVGQIIGALLIGITLQVRTRLALDREND